MLDLAACILSRERADSEGGGGRYKLCRCTLCYHMEMRTIVGGNRIDCLVVSCQFIRTVVWMLARLCGCPCGDWTGEVRTREG